MMEALLGSTRKISTELADAIDFDRGSNDFLGRSSDLVGNKDSPTFTLSFWVWPNTSVGTPTVYGNVGGRFSVKLVGYGIQIMGADQDQNIRLSVTTAANTLPKDSWSHVLVSIDLSNPSSRAVYVNDLPQAATWATYMVSSIAFKTAVHRIGATAFGVGTADFTGRLSHLYLDYTYRDLSIEANRRLFITEDRKPGKGQGGLNPILYLPLDDPEDPGYNAGTGGHFTLIGVVARSGRGPSQFNAPYSMLNGSTQFLSRNSLIGAVNAKEMTLSIWFNSLAGSGSSLFNFSGTSRDTFYISHSANSIVIQARDDSSGIAAFTATISNLPGLTYNRNTHLALSLDLTNPAKRHVYVNGRSVDVTWGAYSNRVMEFTHPCRIGRNYQAALFNGSIGQVLFGTRYIDLSDPANLARLVAGTGADAKPVDLGVNGDLPFGTPPLIYLPMYGNNAGKNYGTGGDFSVSSGPFPGARGPNEYWGNKAYFDGSTSLNRSAALSGLSNGHELTICFWIGLSSNGHIYTHGGNSVHVSIASNKITIRCLNSVGGTAFQVASSVTLASDTNSVHVSVRLSGTPIGVLIINGAVDAAAAWTLNAGNIIDLTRPPARFASSTLGGAGFHSVLSEFYLAPAFINFGQEANRLKFRDAFGNPVALLPQIEQGAISEPAVYMRFDPANPRRNDGYGGDFSPFTGTITDGGQF